MTEFFSKNFFASNRARLRQAHNDKSPIVITAHVSLQKAADEAYTFHQDRSFWYLTGIDEPGATLVIDDDNKEYIILPERDAVQDLFDGEFSDAELSKKSGIITVLSAKDGWKRLGVTLKQTNRAATLSAGPAYIEVIGLYTNPARALLARRLKKLAPNVELTDLRPTLMRMRMVKQAPEIKAIERAVEITMASIEDATTKAKLASYKHEYELEAEFAYGIRRRGAAGHAFSPIVAGGKNACTIHYMENNAPLANNQLIVMDVGAEVDHYAADITRTVIKGEPTKRQIAVVNTVKEALELGINQLKPGAIFAECEKQVRVCVGEKLRELGLIKDATDQEAIRKYYPHAPHYLGLDVHDVGDYQVPLEPGMVMTIEPGIYIPEEGIGVRIEDDILITKNGHKVLSERLPRAVA
jgi:Xaa-Pro aminopeptidase